MKTVSCVLVTAVTLFGSSIASAVPLSGTSFADFNTGVSVDGQGGWSATGNFDEEVTMDGDNFVWRVSNATTSGSFGDMPFAPRPGGIVDDTEHDPVNGEPVFFTGEKRTSFALASKFTGQFDFKSATGAAQPGLRITVSIDNGQGGRQSFVAIEDNGDGLEIITYDVNKNTGEFIGPITIAKKLSYTKWYTLGMELTTARGPKNDKVRYFLNGRRIHIDTSWEQYYRNFQLSLHPRGVTAQTLIFRLSGDPVPAVMGNGLYIDNVFTSNNRNHKQKF